MSPFVAALPMYDWPEVRAEVDGEWASLRDRLRGAGIDAPEALSRDIDMHDIWLRPDLLLAQTCWGPMELGLQDQVTVVGQPSYDGIEGGQGPLYSSGVLMRHGEGGRAAPGADGKALLPLPLMRGKRLAYNSRDSMSGIIALTRDLAEAGESLDIFSARIETGAHRASIRAVAAGNADVCAIDCRSWHLAKQFEPAAADVEPVGWTALRKGLPMITAKATPPETVATLRGVLANA